MLDKIKVDRIKLTTKISKFEAKIRRMEVSDKVDENQKQD